MAAQGRRVLVAGASGFVGRRVTAMLAEQGWTVTALVRPENRVPGADTVIAADLCSDLGPALRQVGKVDVVVQLAQAPGWHAFPTNAGAIAAVGVAATCRLAEFACEVGAQALVFASSGGVHGASPVPIRETDPIRPAAELGFYLAAKAAAESLLGYFEGRLAVRVLRPFFIYGPGQADDFLIPRLARSVAEGTPIRLAGGRGPRLNPVFIDDAARAVVAACAADGAWTANLAGPQTLDLSEVVAILARLQGRTPVLDITGDAPHNFVADLTVMRQRLCTPEVMLEAGLAAILEGAA